MICRHWAEKLGLPDNVIIGTGAVDCHVGAIGAQITSGEMVKVLGTSTCDILVIPDPHRSIPGICGQVDGSVLPGLTGVEAGQSAFGDIFNWFRRFISYGGNVMLADLEKEALRIPPGAGGICALDWFNGRRTPFANSGLTGVISGLNLGSTPPMVYRALVESAVMGSKAILEHCKQENLEINGITAVGGISYKSPLVMQMCADAFNMPIKVVKTDQSCALGAAMMAATAAGYFTSIQDAALHMGSGYRKTWYPDHDAHDRYTELYNKYSALGKAIENL